MPSLKISARTKSNLEPYNKFSVLFSKENLLSKALIQLCWVRSFFVISPPPKKGSRSGCPLLYVNLLFSLKYDKF
jgi:hypothetical protein